MSLDLTLANQIHAWLIHEGSECHSQEDLDTAIDRFLTRWPRVKSDVLRYVSEMLRAELHPRTLKSSKIIDGVRERIAHAPPLRRRWWLIDKRSVVSHE